MPSRILPIASRRVSEALTPHNSRSLTEGTAMQGGRKKAPVWSTVCLGELKAYLPFELRNWPYKGGGTSERQQPQKYTLSMKAIGGEVLRKPATGSSGSGGRADGPVRQPA